MWISSIKSRTKWTCTSSVSSHELNSSPVKLISFASCAWAHAHVLQVTTKTARVKENETLIGDFLEPIDGNDTEKPGVFPENEHEKEVLLLLLCGCAC